MTRIPLWLKIAVSAWAAVYVPAYLGHYGALPFLWFCNLGNLMLVAGIWLESALLVSMVALSVLLQVGIQHLPAAQALFEIVTLSPATWAMIVLAALIPVSALELAKLVRRSVLDAPGAARGRRDV